jgi:Tol biopolymer transport system component
MKCLKKSLIAFLYPLRPFFVTEAKDLTHIITICGGLFLCAFSFCPPVHAQTTTRVSVSSQGIQANSYSYSPSISADGRYVTFESEADTLVAGDTNTEYDIFVHDRNTGDTKRVSVSTAGAQANDSSYSACISGDGGFVAFLSSADNLVTGDTNYYADVFVHDCNSRQTIRVSVSSAGEEANGSNYSLAISGDGRYVAFESGANNLVEDSTGAGHIFVHDRITGETTCVSVSSQGEQGNILSLTPSISGDARYVAFASLADNLVAGDTNQVGDIFVRDRSTGETTRVSVSSSGEQGNDFSYSPSISANGRYVAFESLSRNLVGGDTNGDYDVFVHDRSKGKTTLVSISSQGEQGNSYSRYPSISAEGRYVTFQSLADNLVGGDTNDEYDVFVHDRVTGETSRVSVSSQGEQGNSYSRYPSISADGRYVAFESRADNLVTGDTNYLHDIFVHGPIFTVPPTPSYAINPAIPLLLLDE